MSPETRANEPLSEAAAWREIARRIAEGETDGASSHAFLCRMVDCVMPIERPVERAMLARIRWHMGGLSGPAYLWESFGAPGGAISCAEEGAQSRVLAALWLALEAEDESRSALRSSGPGAP